MKPNCFHVRFADSDKLRYARMAAYGLACNIAHQFHFLYSIIATYDKASRVGLLSVLDATGKAL